MKGVRVERKYCNLKIFEGKLSVRTRIEYFVLSLRNSAKNQSTPSHNCLLSQAYCYTSCSQARSKTPPPPVFPIS